jgi:hypothetical protein
MKRFSLLPLFLICLLFASCSGDSPASEEELAAEPNDGQAEFTFSFTDQTGHPIHPVLVTLYPAEAGTGGEPLARFQNGRNGKVTGTFEKNRPVKMAIEPAWHQPMELFIPSYTMDQLQAEITPGAAIMKQEIRPALVGDFNDFDPFRAVDMEKGVDGSWTASVETQLRNFAYKIVGFSINRTMHGSEGLPEIGNDKSKIISVAANKGENIMEFKFNPDTFPDSPQRAEIRFDDAVPVFTRGTASLYAAMAEQITFTERYQQNDEALAESFTEYLEHIETIRDKHDHRDVELAHRIAQARFLDIMPQDDRWVDRLLNDLESSSELWLFHPEIVYELFTHSSRMEAVSQDLWNIYRQHRYGAIQSEALFSLLHFHYDRGEDEEWYEAHFELVRSYPESKRINHSYREGFAPEAVVHIGRYFPDLAYAPLDESAESIRPADISSSLTIIYFWSPDDTGNREQFEILSKLYRQYSEDGLKVIPIALNGNPGRIRRFHDHFNHPWRGAFENLTSPQVQVLGITQTPHTIFLDESNRVLFHGESILDEQLPKYVEQFYRN